jgi:hypothetical protein
MQAATAANIEQHPHQDGEPNARVAVDARSYRPDGCQT